MREIRTELPYWIWDAIEDRDAKVHFVRGGLGAAKTTNAATWHIDRCFINAAPRGSPIPSLSWAVAQTHGKIEDTLIPAFTRQLLSVYGMREDVHYRILRGKHYKLVFNSINHQIDFKSGDQPKLLSGANITHYLITEAGLQVEDVWGRCRQRARSDFAVLVQGMIEGTPEDDPRAAWYERVANFEGYDPATGYRVFEVWTEDNPHLNPSTEEYVAGLRQQYAHDPQRLEAYLYGRFVRFDQGTAYKNYRSRAHDIEDIAPEPSRPIDLTFDFNASPLAFVALQRVPYFEWGERKLRWVAVDEANEDNSQLDDVCLEFEEKFPVRRFADTPITIYGDMSGHAESHKARNSDYDVLKIHLRKLGYRNVSVRAARSNPRETQSVEALNRLLLDDHVRICKRCTKLRSSLQKTAWKDGVRKLDKPSGETHTHHSDAMKYWAFQMARGENLSGERPLMGRNL